MQVIQYFFFFNPQNWGGGGGAEGYFPFTLFFFFGGGGGSHSYTCVYKLLCLKLFYIHNLFQRKWKHLQSYVQFLFSLNIFNFAFKFLKLPLTGHYVQFRMFLRPNRRNQWIYMNHVSYQDICFSFTDNISLKILPKQLLYL